VHHATAVMVDIPESLRHVIDQQLEQLHPEERFCLEVASVAGRAFSAAAVAAGTDDQVEEMETRYAALARRGYGGAAVGRGICGPGDYARGAILGRTQHVHARLSAHRHGCAVEGLEQMQAGWAAIQTTGVQLNRVSFLARLAEALLHAGQPDTGLAVLAEALAFIHTSGERWWEAECHRLWGECLLAQQEPKHRAREVAARFQHALDIARHQHARSLELCAAMSLSRLWQQQGKREEAMRDSSSAVI
jgi:hypothetical protein